MGLEGLGLVLGVIGILLLLAIVWMIISWFVLDGMVLLICSSIFKFENKWKFVFRYIWPTFGIGLITNYISLVIYAGFDFTPKIISLSIIQMFVLFVATFFLHWFLVFRKQEDCIKNRLSLVFALIPVVLPITIFFGV